MKEWKLLYDSGRITEEITSTAHIDISGNDELMIIAKAVPTTTNSTGRNSQLVITNQYGNQYRLILGNNLLYPNGNPRVAVATVRKICDFVYTESVVSVNSTDVFTVGATVENLTLINNSIVKFDGNLDKIWLTNINSLETYKFGIGSRFVIFGR